VAEEACITFTFKFGFGCLCGVAECVDEAVAESGSEFCRLGIEMMPGEQPDHFSRRHAKGRADGGRRGDAALLQLPANQHAQPDRDQPVGLSGAALLGRELGLLRQRGRRRLVREQAHAVRGSRAGGRQQLHLTALAVPV
jgi:hypothetical protein